MSVRLGAPAKPTEWKRREETKGGERRPKGGNRPTDHDLEIAIFEAP
jgi:hypothetical protein